MKTKVSFFDQNLMTNQKLSKPKLRLPYIQNSVALNTLSEAYTTESLAECADLVFDYEECENTLENGTMEPSDVESNLRAGFALAQLAVKKDRQVYAVQPDIMDDSTYYFVGTVEEITRRIKRKGVRE